MLIYGCENATWPTKFRSSREPKTSKGDSFTYCSLRTKQLSGHRYSVYITQTCWWNAALSLSLPNTNTHTLKHSISHTLSLSHTHTHTHTRQHVRTYTPALHWNTLTREHERTCVSEGQGDWTGTTDMELAHVLKAKQEILCRLVH